MEKRTYEQGFQKGLEYRFSVEYEKNWHAGTGKALLNGMKYQWQREYICLRKNGIKMPEAEMLLGLKKEQSALGEEIYQKEITETGAEREEEEREYKDVEIAYMRQVPESVPRKEEEKTYQNGLDDGDYVGRERGRQNGWYFGYHNAFVLWNEFSWLLSYQRLREKGKMQKEVKQYLGLTMWQAELGEFLFMQKQKYPNEKTVKEILERLLMPVEQLWTEKE